MNIDDFFRPENEVYYRIYRFYSIFYKQQANTREKKFYKEGKEWAGLLGMTVDRQCYYEIRTDTLLTFHLNISAMLYDKTIADRQTKSNALHTAFSGKKCIEYFIYIIFFNPNPGVRYFDNNLFIFDACLYGQGSAIGHSVPGIMEEI